MRISSEVVKNGTILGFILSSHGSGDQPSELLWFLSVVAIFLSYWPVSFFSAFPPSPSWACHCSARHWGEASVRRKANASWPSPLVSLLSSTNTQTPKQQCIKERQQKAPESTASCPNFRNCLFNSCRGRSDYFLAPFFYETQSRAQLTSHLASGHNPQPS